MTDISLVAFDLDGTLLDSQKRISTKIRNALKEIQERGVYITLITGRTYAATRGYAEELEIMTPMGLVHGAWVRDRMGLEISKRIIPKAGVREAIEWAAEFECIPFVVGSGAEGNLTVCEEDRQHPVVQVTLHSESDQIRHDEIEYLRRVDFELDAFAIYLVGKKDRVSSLLEHAESQPIKIFNSGRFPIHGPIGEDDFRQEFEVALFSPIGSDKRIALETIAGTLGVSMESVLSFGDWHNDIPMLQAAGTAVLMGNAPDAVAENLQHARLYRTGTNDGSGVLDALARFNLI